MNEEKNETVTIPVAEFNQLISRVNALEQRDAPLPAPSEVKGRTCAVAFLDGKPVVAFANKGDEKYPRYTYELPDPLEPKLTVLYVDVILRNPDGTSTAPIKIRYEDLLNTVMQECPIVDTKITPVETQQGYTDRVEVRGNDYKGTVTGEKVPVIIKSEKRMFTVQLPDKSTLNIDEKYVNINRAPPQS